MSLATTDIALPVADHAACSACALCLLVCPIWRQTRDIELTPLGCSKALQRGAPIEDLAATAQWCNLCGACAPVCPERIDLVGMMRSVRRRLRLDSNEAELATATAREPLVAQSAVRSRLGPGDLLVIEPRSYHADYERRVKVYDELRRETGCMLNLDLQRIAIPARLPVPADYADACDYLAQARWIVQGFKIQRIVVEDPADRGVFERLGAWPVMSVDELAKETR
ncbi:MAG: 4Fe-4S dicluster domain-containing protein [Proteobacteria bacterium]|nr:4Fe-4S dicluster domain-containing protein [Pseudomonadota bacterium]